MGHGKMGHVKKVIQISTSSIKRGEVVVNGEELFDKYKDVKMTSVVVTNYRSPSKDNGVLHDFTFVSCTMQNVNPGMFGQVLYIKAEKRYVTGEDAKGNEVKTCKERDERHAFMEEVKRQLRECCAKGQIHIEISSNQPDTGEWQQVVPAVYSNDGWGQITLNELVDVLKDHSTRYSLLDKNCWKYAMDTFSKVIEKFINHRDTKKKAKMDLEKVLMESKLLFPILPSAHYKNGAFILGIVATVVFVGLQVIILYVEHPTDLAVGRCLKTAFDALLQQAKPRGLRIPLICTKTRAWKFVYLALKWFKRLSGLSPLMNPSLIGKVVRILSSKVLLTAGTAAITVALVAAILFLMYNFYEILSANLSRTEGDSPV